MNWLSLFCRALFPPHCARQHVVGFFTIQMHLGMVFLGSSGLRAVKWPSPKQCKAMTSPLDST